MECFVFVKVKYPDEKEEDFVVGKFFDLDKCEKLELDSDLKLHEKQKGKLVLGFRSTDFKTVNWFSAVPLKRVGNLSFIISPPYHKDKEDNFYLMQYLFDPNVFARFEREDDKPVDLALYEDEDEIGGQFQTKINQKNMNLTIEEVAERSKNVLEKRRKVTKYLNRHYEKYLVGGAQFSGIIQLANEEIIATAKNLQEWKGKREILFSNLHPGVI
ncbi:uncharacterized protein SAPINGB_P000553 [Magnusiomyces paraingens]|uniref:Uncharacterized protein n=1 Tax=Magnusiomyces paraingens TaxID=2606893 RepID=A0A5E8B1P5_9ASCO|nr:uncharacterized protein SAPINGB_P000553 [Saprochaete ingens]VVT44845.1 unnamed protein product [Saprochaete ingens]